MDPDRFDAISRLAATSPRRRILAGLVGGALIGVGLLRREPDTAMAQYYEDRGATCDATRPCTSPCRWCNHQGRCVYACPNATHTCDANARGTCPGFGPTDPYPISQGCCVCRRPDCT
jgi:hypothetical protein